MRRLESYKRFVATLPSWPTLARVSGLALVIMTTLALAARGQSAPSESSPARVGDHETIQQLLRRVNELEAEIRALKALAPKLRLAQDPAPVASVRDAKEENPGAPQNTTPAQPLPAVSQNEQEEAKPEAKAPEHAMAIPGGGPALKIRGFLDFNFGAGSDANPLVFPLGAPAHNTFQFGEFDLYITSKLSDTIDFLGEFVVGADATNEWGVDLERLLLEYRPSDYFQIGAGRFHTSIGYYNTAFHHGTWFQTATGRPFLFLFEDSGGILPVHSVGVTASGLVPRTGKLGLHWVAEVGNGRSSSPLVGPVQNFLSDRNRKAVNFAVYAKPDWVPGLEVGASYYRDRLVPPDLPHVNQSIASVHVVYVTPAWELLNEGVFLRHRPDGSERIFNTPGFYTQISRRVLGKYRPYFRYQYINVPSGDPVNAAVGRQNGPSVGLRIDLADYVALKFQYNHLAQHGVRPLNGLDGQVSFTF